MAGESERSIAFNFSGASALGLCFVVAFVSIGYFGHAIAREWRVGQESTAAAQVEVSRQLTEQAKYNCLKWPLTQESTSQAQPEEKPKRAKVKR